MFSCQSLSPFFLYLYTDINDENIRGEKQVTRGINRIVLQTLTFTRPLADYQRYFHLSDSRFRDI